MRINLLDFNSSVDVGYGFHAFISKLLIVIDMYWQYCKPYYMLNGMLHEYDYVIVIK